MMQVGVGLRSKHYEDALQTASVDFVEVHTENFFADGGVSHAQLDRISEQYKLSFHGTSLGLGSFTPPPMAHIQKMRWLIDHYSPFLISDHACFSWSNDGESIVHAGDLLPIRFDKETLNVMCRNIRRVQDIFGHQILIENISSYLPLSGSVIPEAEFFNLLCQSTGCAMLLDVHNIQVNAVNQQSPSPLEAALYFISELDSGLVGEIHLAGIAAPSAEMWIDDHSGPVSDDCWTAYSAAIKRFGKVPTLIEWDSKLPEWSDLISEAKLAEEYANKVCAHA
ncbi:hypothetical protein LCGC14_2481620 [marine sediment metagenome]|uniref:DUF692 domain-containing protein n=1 Tax=marine sediment metagenome TaxID=412755 RepID=A0A0F9B897_9ZZZZ